MLVTYTSDRDYNPGAPAAHVGDNPNLRWQTKSKTNPAQESGVCYTVYMFTKQWSVEHQGNYLEVSNGWNFKGETEEKITFNKKVLYEKSYSLFDLSDIFEGTGTTYKFTASGNDYVVKIGSAWHLHGMACRIDVNGKYLGGNKIVLFANHKKDQT